jgi:spermidine/putrescine transport system substrate-binding protein
VPAEDLDAILRRMQSTRVNRRGFLAAAGLAGTAAALAACAPSGSATTAPSAAASASAAPSPSASAGASASASAGAVAEPSYATEGELYMYNWSDYVAPENIDAFKAKYNISKFTYDTYASNEEMLTKLQGGAKGLYDVAAPTAEFLPALAEGGYIVKPDWSRVPNKSYINEIFQNFFKDAPNNQYNDWHLPKDWGTTGIGIRTKIVQEEVKTWKQFFDVAPKYSGRIVIVDSPGDVFTAPLKALGYSLNSVDPAQLEEVRTMLMALAPHVLALDSDTYNEKLRTEEAVLGIVWTGGVLELRDEEETKDTVYQIPDDGTLFWLDTWVLMNEAPHPEASYAFLNFIHDPEVQAKETISNTYATPNDAAKQFLPPEMLNDPAIFVPDATLANLEGAEDVSTDPLRQDIWAQFKSAIGG